MEMLRYELKLISGALTLCDSRQKEGTTGLTRQIDRTDKCDGQIDGLSLFKL